MRQLSPSGAARLAYCGGLANALVEASLGGLLAGLFTVLVARAETQLAAWPVGLLCAGLAAASLFLERRPSHAACLARVDRRLSLGGALELGVELEAGLRTAPRFRDAVEVALAGRLAPRAVLCAALVVRPAFVALALVGALGLASVLADADAALSRELVAERLAGASSFARTNAPDTNPPAEAAEPDSNAARAADVPDSPPVDPPAPGAISDVVGTVPGAPEEPAAGAPGNLSEAELGLPALKDGAESPKLAPGAPSGVTLAPDGGKMDPESALPPAGAWWPARHETVVRAWLRSRNQLARSR